MFTVRIENSDPEEGYDMVQCQGYKAYRLPSGAVLLKTSEGEEYEITNVAFIMNHGGTTIDTIRPKRK